MAWMCAEQARVLAYAENLCTTQHAMGVHEQALHAMQQSIQFHFLPGLESNQCRGSAHEIGCVGSLAKVHGKLHPQHGWDSVSKIQLLPCLAPELAEADSQEQ